MVGLGVTPRVLYDICWASLNLRVAGEESLLVKRMGQRDDIGVVAGSEASQLYM